MESAEATQACSRISALPSNDQLAFTAIAENSLGANNYTLAHEIGHIIGAGHERGNPDGARGPFTYSYGYRFTAAGILQHDIMSYDPGLEIPYYANPAVSYHGARDRFADRFAG